MREARFIESSNSSMENKLSVAYSMLVLSKNLRFVFYQ